MWGYCRGADTKHKAAAFDRSLIEQIPIPVTSNGAIVTGKLPDGKILSVIDFDVEAGQPELPLDVLDEVSRHTFVVRSPRGGLHVYFYTNDELPTAKHIEAHDSRVSQIDRRGTNSIIFAPGCKFSDHDFKPYVIALDQPILTISVETFWKIWDAHGKTRFEVRAKDPEKRAAQRHKNTERKARAAGKRDFPSSPRVAIDDDILTYHMFPPCVAVLMGCCDRGEHLEHDERVYLASFMATEGWDPEEVIMRRFEHMPDYDAAETAKQVWFIVAKGYKPRGCKKLKEFNMCPGLCPRAEKS